LLFAAKLMFSFVIGSVSNVWSVLKNYSPKKLLKGMLYKSATQQWRIAYKCWKQKVY